MCSAGQRGARGTDNFEIKITTIRNMKFPRVFPVGRRRQWTAVRQRGKFSKIFPRITQRYTTRRRTAKLNSPLSRARYRTNEMYIKTQEGGVLKKKYTNNNVRFHNGGLCSCVFAAIPVLIFIQT